MIAQAVVAALGVWLMASPGVVGYGEPGSTVAWVAGPVLASTGFVAAFAIGRPLRWLNVPAGVALAALAPAVGASAAGLANLVPVGIATALLSLATGPADDRYAGGWGSLFHRD